MWCIACPTRQQPGPAAVLTTSSTVSAASECDPSRAVSVEDLLLLALLGATVGVFGALVGAGGGFILTPVLLALYPTDSPPTLTAIPGAVGVHETVGRSPLVGWARDTTPMACLSIDARCAPGRVSICGAASP